MILILYHVFSSIYLIMFLTKMISLYLIHLLALHYSKYLPTSTRSHHYKISYWTRHIDRINWAEEICMYVAAETYWRNRKLFANSNPIPWSLRFPLLLSNIPKHDWALGADVKDPTISLILPTLLVVTW